MARKAGPFACNKPIECNPDERYLSTIESFYTQMSNRDKLTTYLYHTTVISSKKEINEDQIKKCFFEISKTHFLMQSSLKKMSNGDYKVHKEDRFSEHNGWIDIKTETVEKKDQWKDVVSENLKIRFDISKGPIWRLLWIIPKHSESLFEYVLVLVCQHVLMDMISCMDMIHQQFLPLLDNLLTKNEMRTCPSPQIPLGYPLEKLIHPVGENYSFLKVPVPMNVKFFLKLIHLKDSAKNCFSFFRFWDKKLPKKIPVIKEEEKECETVHGQFPFAVNENTSQSFFQLCKKRSAKVHSVLLVITSNAFSEAKIKFPEFTYKNEIFYIVDHRKFIKELTISPLTLGSYVGIAPSTVTSCDADDTDEFFSYCREVNEGVQEANKPGSDEVMYVTTELMRQGRFLDEFQNNYFLSNAGRFDYNGSLQNVSISEHYFSIVQEKSGLYIGTLTYNKKMLFCIGYDDEWYSRSFVEFIANHIKSSIEHIACN